MKSGFFPAFFVRWRISDNEVMMEFHDYSATRLRGSNTHCIDLIPSSFPRLFCSCCASVSSIYYIVLISSPNFFVFGIVLITGGP